MNLLCPNCQKMLTVAEQFAGQTMKCPSCAGAFTVPGLPPGGFPAAPPMPSPPMQAPLPPPPTPSYQNNRAPASGGGYQHVYSLSFRPDVLNVLPPLALVFLFLLLFLPWLQSGVGVADSSVATSYSGWDAAFGKYATTFGTLFVIFFILTLLLSFGVTSIPFVPEASLPGALRPLLPLLPALVGLGSLGCLFLLVAMVAGFDQEGASKDVLEGVRMNKDLMVTFSQTFWMRLAVFCEIVAIVAASLMTWLNLRGRSVAPPQLAFNW